MPRQTKYRKRENGVGSVYKSSDIVHRPWYAAAPAVIDTETGKTSREIIGHYETRKEALEALESYNKAPTKKIRSTFSDLYSEWESISFRSLSKSMRDCYTAAYKKLFPLHKKIFKDIRTADMQKVIDYYEDEHYELDEKGKPIYDKDGSPKIKPPLSYSSLHHMTVLLGLVYTYAMQNDVVNKDYSKFVVISARKAAEKQAFSDVEVRKIEEAAQNGTPNADLVLIMCYTGYRISEFLGLTKFNYNADENVFAGGGNKTEAGRNKIVPVHPKIKPYIEKHLNDGGKTIFCKADGTPYNVKSFRDSIYYPTLEKIGVRKLTPHATRRTFATRAAAAGVRPEDLIRMMGHSDYKIDTDSYIKQEASTLVNAIQLIK